MSRRAPRTANAVSLFPFLAVLICAMGALILLLLVITRRIRHQQSTTAVAAVMEPASLDEGNAQPAAMMAPQSLISDPADRPLEPLFSVESPVPTPDPNDAWRERLMALEAQQTDLISGVQSQRSQVEQLRTSVHADSRALEELTSQATALEAAKEKLRLTYRRLREQKSTAADRATRLCREIDEAREQLANSDSKFTIMPFDGRLGTTRRPIIIECTAQGISFVSEGVTLRASDLNGFTPRYNPLLYASQALTRYWDRKDRRSAVRQGRGEPYVLLVVRPQGTVAYYVARTLLGRMDDSFGYELVREDQEFVWPETDAEATIICRSIVERMLSERDQLIASVPTANRDPIGRFSDDGGEFWLEEVDRLRNPQREVTINGQRFSREPAPTRQQRRSRGGDDSDTDPSRFGGRSTSRDLKDVKDLERSQAPPLADGMRSGTRAGERRTDAPTSNSIRLERDARSLTNPFSDHDGPPHLTNPDEARLSRSAGSLADRPTQSPLRKQAQASLDRSFPRSGRTGSSVNSGQPQWGVRTPGGMIGNERDVIVRVTSTQVTIADETAFPITAGLPPDDLRQLLAVHLEQHVQSWGEPPRSFYWLPAVKFIVSPGGNQFYERLTSVVQQWKLRSTVEYVLE